MLLVGLVAFGLGASRAFAQVSATLTGVVTDPSAAAVSGADVTAKEINTGLTRSATSDNAGLYQIVALPVGRYELHVKKEGFSEEVRTGIQLVVGQEAVVDLALRLGQVTEQVTVNADAPVVNTSTADISGLVGEQQVKDLPLNGRSYDLLMLLNPAVVNFTFEKTGGTGISNSTTANNFAVSGNRPQQNLFLLNGIEFSGAAENNMTPGGASGLLLGVDAVREFNLLRDSYGAEYGKKPGGQVSIVTQSGTNQFHGAIYEFLRNNDLDEHNYFDAGASAPPFQRNQFGVAAGGPISKNKTFIFGNYEGFRQNLHETSVALVPDAQARTDAATVVKNMGLLNLWPVAPAGSPDFKVAGNDGVAEVLSSPLQHIREDFGTVRLDQLFSSTDTFSGIYTIDDSYSNTATPADPYSTDLLSLREQVLSLQETHVFSPSFLNTVRFGFSRAGYYFTGEPTPGTPAATISPFLSGVPFVGAVVVGGSQASNPQAQLGLAGSNNGSNLHVDRNLFTITDDAGITSGRHQFHAGVWFQAFQSNETIALSQYGQMTFTGLPTFLTGTASFLYDPTPTEMNWRSFFGAWYLEDVIRLRSNLTVSLGFRNEFTTGWNEAHGRAANYLLNLAGVPICASKPAANICLPNVGNSTLSVNSSNFLPQPRIGIAWSPFGHKTVVRAGFGIYNDLQDALGYRTDQNAPFNPTYNIGATSIATTFPGGAPINRSAAPPASALLVPGGVQPNLASPTLISYSLRVERELTTNTSLTVGYVGSHGYHEIVGADANVPVPVICPASPCPATFPTTINPVTLQPLYGALAGKAVPAGTYYNPTATKPNTSLANTWTWYSIGVSSYNSLQVDLNHRFNDGFLLRGVYTWSKALDDGDSLNATAANNAVALLSNPYNPRADYGPATYDVRSAASIDASYELPIGHNKPFMNGLSGFANGVVSGWTVNSIVTLQGGFPFTPQLSYNPANNGDTRNPVRPFLNPAFTGPVVTGNVSQWFNPNAFIAPPSTSGFYGNLGRDTYTGPGLATWDFSMFKNTRVNERMNVQFRAELFNLLNRANFNTPNLITDVLEAPPNTTVPEQSPTAGQIISTSTTSRQIQFGLKLLW